MMTAEEAAERGKTLSFEKVWAMFEETDRKYAETAALIAQLERNVDRVTGNVGGLNRSMGELIETLIAARLWEKFPGYGLTRAYQRLPIYDKNNQIGRAHV
jgi:hypothetical protein